MRTWIAILFRPAAAHGAVVAARAENARVVLMALHFHWRCSQIEEDGFALHAFVHLRRGAQTLLPLVVKFQTAHTTNVKTFRGLDVVPKVFQDRQLPFGAIDAFPWTCAALGSGPHIVERSKRAIATIDAFRDLRTGALLEARAAAATNFRYVDVPLRCLLCLINEAL